MCKCHQMVELDLGPWPAEASRNTRLEPTKRHEVRRARGSPQMARWPNVSRLKYQRMIAAEEGADGATCGHGTSHGRRGAGRGGPHGRPRAEPPMCRQRRCPRSSHGALQTSRPVLPAPSALRTEREAHLNIGAGRPRAPEPQNHPSVPDQREADEGTLGQEGTCAQAGACWAWTHAQRRLPPGGLGHTVHNRWRTCGQRVPQSHCCHPGVRQFWHQLGAELPEGHSLGEALIKISACSKRHGPQYITLQQSGHRSLATQAHSDGVNKYYHFHFAVDRC